MAALPRAAATPEVPARTREEVLVEIDAERGGVGSRGWYAPDTVVVPRGTVVTWINQDVRPHSVTSAEGRFDSGLIGPGDRWSRRFDAEGEFVYECHLCFCNPMAGRVVVRPAR